MPVATPGRLLAELQQEVGAIHSPWQMMSTESTQPNQWHPVGYNRIRQVQDFLERRIMLSLENSVHARRGDRMAASMAANPLLHSSHHVLCLYRADRHTQHFKFAHIFQQPLVMARARRACHFRNRALNETPGRRRAARRWPLSYILGLHFTMECYETVSKNWKAQRHDSCLGKEILHLLS